MSAKFYLYLVEGAVAQLTRGIYRITQIPALHAMIQAMLGGPDIAERVVREVIQPVDGEDVLDLGCGSGKIMPPLRARRYVGVDLNPAHIESAKQKYPATDFRAGDAIAFLETTSETFDLITLMGFLHHLDDAQVIRLMQGVKRVLRSSGRAIALDPAFEPRQNPIAHLMARLDSGRNVRTLEEYLALERGVFPETSGHLRRDLLRIPYTHAVTICQQT